MKLMVLGPEGQRLRRIARAHAAGEFSVEEYRQARRVLLEKLADAGSTPFEDTFRRNAATQRRAPQAANDSLRVSFAGTSPGARLTMDVKWFILATGTIVAAMWVWPFVS